jgi:hypothetical protein
MILTFSYKLDTDSIEVKFLINEKPVFVSISREIFTTFDPVEKIAMKIIHI